jgi:hypothetical protein
MKKQCLAVSAYRKEEQNEYKKNASSSYGCVIVAVIDSPRIVGDLVVCC